MAANACTCDPEAYDLGPEGQRRYFPDRGCPVHGDPEWIAAQDAANPQESGRESLLVEGFREEPIWLTDLHEIYDEDSSPFGETMRTLIAIVELVKGRRARFSETSAWHNSHPKSPEEQRLDTLLSRCGVRGEE